MNDPTCHSEACAGRCARSIHAYSYERGQYRYMRCTTHRSCREFMPEPTASEVQTSAELAVGEMSGIGGNLQSEEQPLQVTDFTVAEIFPTPLASYDAWWCETCGSRAFNRRTCCSDKRMAPIRVEIHSREVD